MDNNEAPKIKKTKKRSSTYPSFALQEVIEATKTLKEQLGDGPYSRESAAVALGYKGITGSSGTKISSCVQFGLLEKNGNTYTQSELAKRIFNFIDNEELQESLVEAFKRPPLYQKLLGEYSGKSLPLMIESILVRNYGIQENAARSAANNFKQSAEYAGMLTNGVISARVTGDVVEPTEQNELSHSIVKESQRDNSASDISQNKVTSNYVGSLPVTIPGTEVTILFPSKFAYFLSVGSFRAGIEQLAKDIQAVEPSSVSVEDEEM